MTDSGTKQSTLLIIDDDVEWTELLRIFFSGKYNVLIANSALDAIDAIAINSPTLIILDLVMPSIDGFGLMQRLNSGSPTRIPTVLTTGWGSADIESCAAAIGCAAVLAKPVSLPKLDEVVQSLIAQARAQGPVASEPPTDEGVGMNYPLCGEVGGQQIEED